MPSIIDAWTEVVRNLDQIQTGVRMMAFSARGLELSPYWGRDINAHRDWIALAQGDDNVA